MSAFLVEEQIHWKRKIISKRERTIISIISLYGVGGVMVRFIFPLEEEVMDMGSSYGTYLENGIRMQKNESYQLSNGDRFYLGDRKNKYIVKVM